MKSVTAWGSGTDMRWLPIILALSACAEPIEVVRKGYVLQSASVNAARGSVGFTVTFGNIYLPQSGASCVGVNVCTETVE